ncbi:hypothetical protein NLI96_g5176 [Meripilus lineatus]|uniref:Cytochrome c oxidase subunit 8, mitochondrial n=1 Tax=Meripilus lineatus TaxID=2056292 RepID=A0AAD5V5K7_9APHY|nr:hypothetical protein NLI96_g5176 [Physisporinus lineatus]
MSPAALSTLRMTSRRIPRQATLQVRSAHGHSPMPFNYSNKRAFTAKFLAFTGVGFALPFIASYWQL